MNKTAGMIYGIWLGILLLVINIGISVSFSLDIYILFFVEIFMFLGLIWYKINVGNGDN